MKFFDVVFFWFIRWVFDLVGDSFELDGEVDLLEKVFDLIDDVFFLVFNK